jgi:uncharacterized protein (TIGR02246 family)
MPTTAGSFDFKSAIDHAIAKFETAANARDAAAIASLYAENATLLPQGSSPVKGRGHIQQYWTAFFAAGASDAQIRSVEVSSIGDLAYEIGTFQANMPQPQGGTARTQGKYVVIWQRQQDGSIKMLVDIFNTNS